MEGGDDLYDGEKLEWTLLHAKMDGTIAHSEPGFVKQLDLGVHALA